MNLLIFFTKCYSSIQNRNRVLIYLRVYSFLRFVVRSLANIILPIYFRLTNRNEEYSLHNINDEKLKIIVSLTSFPARIDKVWMVIETMFRQTCKPDKIILWLSRVQFPTEDSIPKMLLAQRERGLEICLIDNDIRSHKKYYYAMQKYPDDIIVTIDDDIFYRPDLIEKLYDKYMENRHSVICAYAYKILYDESNKIKPYRTWQSALDSDCVNVFFGSGGGTLFPPNSLYKDVLDIKLATSLCPLADDIWLNAMAFLKGTTIIKVFDSNLILPILNKKSNSLSSENLWQDKNDIQIRNVIDYYSDRNLNVFSNKL